MAHEQRLDILRALLARLRGEPAPAMSPALQAPEQAVGPAPASSPDRASSGESTFVAPGLAPPAPPARTPRLEADPRARRLEILRGLLVRLGPA